MLLGVVCLMCGQSTDNTPGIEFFTNTARVPGTNESRVRGAACAYAICIYIIIII